MISRIILSSVFSIIAFAGTASAQHAKVIDGTRLGTVSPSAQTAQIYRNVNGVWTVLNSGAVAQAGSTIRLRIASTNNRGKLIVGTDNVKLSPSANTGKLYVATDVGVYQVPCTGVESAGPTWRGAITLTTSASIGSSSSAKVTISGGAGNDTVYNWKTDPAWKGTCRVLAVKFPDGGEVRAPVSFR